MEKNPVFFGLCGIRKIGKGGNWASDNLTHTMKHITSVVSRRSFIIFLWNKPANKSTENLMYFFMEANKSSDN
uniref:SFRICE_027874 n=1 Tax=Spodoptera frugiperda TaxID=7108 RepID=A0A2H1W9F6_SPOFR